MLDKVDKKRQYVLPYTDSRLIFACRRMLLNHTQLFTLWTQIIAPRLPEYFNVCVPFCHIYVPIATICIHMVLVEACATTVC